MSAIEIKLDEVVTIATAESLQQQLEAVFSEGSEAVIDATAVSKADTAAMQVLYSFVSGMRGSGTPVSWSGCSDVFADCARLLGMSEHLGLEPQN